jgi:hypothetical protein
MYGLVFNLEWSECLDGDYFLNELAVIRPGIDDDQKEKFLISVQSMTGLLLFNGGEIASSGHRLHQATAGARIVVVIVFLVAGHQAVEAEGYQADQAGQQAEATTGAPLLDQLTHGAAVTKDIDIVTKNCAS